MSTFLLNLPIHEFNIWPSKIKYERCLGHFQTYNNALCLYFLVGPLQVQEKLETILMQNFGGQTKSIIVLLKVVY